MMIESSGIRLLDRSGVAEARRCAVQHAARAGFNKTDQGNAAIVATELATNLLRHASNGAIAITSRLPPAAAAVLLVAVDQGPGIEDLQRSFADGYSSAGSSGTGLGAISRLSTILDAYSTPAGTVLAAELVRPAGAVPPSPRVGGFSIAKEGQQTNGDAWDCRSVPGGIAVLVCDGLGHGHYASEASTAAVQAFRNAEWRGPKDALAAVDLALRPTRGAAAAIAFVASSGAVRYCGVGNISACIASGDRCRHLVSYNGILGHTAGKIIEMEYDFGPDSVLVLHTDGITTRWQPGDLGAIWHRHPGLLAGVLYRDFARGSDDAAAVAVKP